MIFIKKIKPFLLILVVFTSFKAVCQTNKKFTVVLDAGHGGKDTGCKYHGFIEKQVALATTLNVGEILEKDNQIKIIYSRTDDTFIELRDRANLANKNKANLFVSIHCNANKNLEAFGSETYVMSLARSKMNLDVAKRENSVILLEDNYKLKYKNFNPNNPESIIGMNAMVEENLNSSASLAAKVQNNFENVANRKSRGVKQEPLWVLDASSMPGVLIELGFLSNQEEGEYLNSAEGQELMAKQIADAIISYKNNYLANLDEIVVDDTVATPTKDEPKNDMPKEIKQTPKTSGNSETYYKIQLCASNKKVGLEPKNFKGMKEISVEKEGNIFKYYAGYETDMDEIKKTLKTAKAKGYKGAFIVTF
jgi:N-acetylmuramoyl-L-alanine amidase